MKRLLLVFGTRPEAIKMAPLVKRLETSADFETRVCITAQHRELLDPVLGLFDISPEYDLDIMTRTQDMYDITSNVLQGIKPVLSRFRPHLLLVHGDTTTTFATALAAFYQKIDVGHVEAGLRTFNIYSPYPEELNRTFTSRIARFHFAPTTLNRDNLLREGVPEKTIVITGNTVIDALFMIVEQIKNDPNKEQRILHKIEANGYTLEKKESKKKRILVTGHRRENFGQGFSNICNAIKDIASRHPEVDIIYPVHYNPNVRQPVFKILSGVENIYLMEPLDYEAFIYLMSRSYLILTDSGGIQEEAPALGKPTLVMRETTERPEAVSAKTAVLVGTEREKISRCTELFLRDTNMYQQYASRQNPYGDGTAAEKIIHFLKREL